MMATRRPRVKVAANLSIRRPTKTNPSASQIDIELPHAAGNDKRLVEENVRASGRDPADVEQSDGIAPSKQGDNVVENEKQNDTKQHFKLPRPVDNNAKGVSSLGVMHETAFLGNINSGNNEDPMSPRRQEIRSAGFSIPFARKRIRTESLTSNKSLPDGVTVNKVARKIATKQEETQRTLENKKEIRKRLTNIENVVDKQNLTMFDMIYYNPVNNPMVAPSTLTKRSSVENLPKSVDGSKREGTRSRSVSKSRSPTPVPSTAQPPKAVPQLTPQLKLGPNGEMILDEASLVIENEREKEIRETLANTDIVYQDEFSGNSGYYTRIKRTQGWSDEETIRFYRCLHTIGTDFSMMLSLFPHRTRRDMKLKFKKEERHNLQLINKALQHPKLFNIAELRQQFAEEDEELERKKAEKRQLLEHEAQKRRNEQLQRKLLLNESKTRNPKKIVSRSQRSLTDTHEQLADSEPPAPSSPSSPPVPVSSALPVSPARPASSPVPPSGLQSPPPTSPPALAVSSPVTPLSCPKRSPRIRKKSRKALETSVAADSDSSQDPSVVSQPYIPNGTVVDSPNIDTNLSHCEQVEEICNPPPTVDVEQSSLLLELESDSASVITLQNLDDQSRTTRRRRKDSRTTVPIQLPPAAVKYESDVDLVYLTAPGDSVAVARPIKTNTFIKEMCADDQLPSGGLENAFNIVTIRSEHSAASVGNDEGTVSGTAQTARATHPENDINPATQESVSEHTITVKSVEFDVCDETPDCAGEDETVGKTGGADPGSLFLLETQSSHGECIVTSAEGSSFSRHMPSESKPASSNRAEKEATNGAEADNDEDGGFSLEDIDINSLVLVESQDANEPNKTIYEIYVSAPETGQLSEKPLDVPPDVIENIRLILEAGDASSDAGG
ncbi:uncharacterized protein LOC131209132 [Anopheles bellator]|uniref:uncharacterized protein LOC131209132 n=1 Tax=Anopheles bellator TaxID=139047 RepID=UPI0026474ABF|nr:uncharacterized protein LOC131209132 [Anopheles bellator]